MDVARGKLRGGFTSADGLPIGLEGFANLVGRALKEREIFFDRLFRRSRAFGKAHHRAREKAEGARLAREHNDANVIAMGARLIGVEMAKACVEAFLSTSFTGGRHAPRVDKLSHPHFTKEPA